MCCDWFYDRFGRISGRKMFWNALVVDKFVFLLNCFLLLFFKSRRLEFTTSDFPMKEALWLLSRVWQNKPTIHKKSLIILGNVRKQAYNTSKTESLDWNKSCSVFSICRCSVHNGRHYAPLLSMDKKSEWFFTNFSKQRKFADMKAKQATYLLQTFNVNSTKMSSDSSF